jgi:hypothetical protein
MQPMKSGSEAKLVKPGHDEKENSPTRFLAEVRRDISDCN